MKKIIVCLLSLLGLGGCAGGHSTVDNSTVKQLDLEKFMGRWYEIARYDHRFERGMSHVTATYSLLGNGRIRVVNEGVKDGKHKTARGKGSCPTLRSRASSRWRSSCGSMPTITFSTLRPTTAMCLWAAVRTSIFG